MREKFEYKEPIFERGRVLKRESWESIRDYPIDALNIQYEGYTNGIIRGLKISVDSSERLINIGRGLVKFNEKIYPINEMQRIGYESSGVWEILKLKFADVLLDKDFRGQLIEIVLDEKECKDNEIEVCRFKLKKGFALRDTYKDFEDMKTEYDTINLINADWSGYERATFSESVLKVFAKEYLKTKEADSTDRNFCYMVLNTREALDIEIIEDYISYKLGKKVKSNDRSLIFNNLLEIMNMTSNLKLEKSVFNRPKKIIVD